MTPAAEWVIFFLNSFQYEVILKPKGTDNIEKLGKTGRVGNTFQDEVIGLQLTIPEPEIPFEYGDALVFSTKLGTNNEILVVSDNIAKVYAIKIDTGELLWTKTNSAPFNSQIKIYDNKVYVVDFNNTLKCFSVEDGSLVFEFLLVSEEW